MRTALADLVDLVLPRHCVGCGLAGVALCPRCGAPAPVRVELAGLTVHAAAPYDAGLRVALIAYKERGRRDLARPLAALLATAISPACAPGAVLVPVPSSPGARRERGGDHVRRLVRPLAHRSVPAVRLVRGVLDSAGLGAGERAANLAGAMLARAPERPGCRAVIVDDIVTTGSTLLETARALRAAGWTVDTAAVVAATARRVTPEPRPRHAQLLPGNHTAATPGTVPRAGLT